MMFRRTAAFAALSVTLILGLAANGSVHAEGLPVTLVMRDGTHVPFTIGTIGRPADPAFLYSDGHGYPYGNFRANIGGAGTQIPVSQIARADLIEPGERAVWRATLRDGRVFDGMVVDASQASLWVRGTNQFGAEEELRSFPRDPDRQPFIAVIFEPDAAAPGEATAPEVRADVDSVTLRNGDILSGSILTEEFTVQASYGTLTFTSEQLASIRIEDAAGKTDQFVLQVGDRVSGVLQNTTIEMALTTGATITLEKGNIASITFATER